MYAYLFNLHHVAYLQYYNQQQLVITQRDNVIANQNQVITERNQTINANIAEMVNYILNDIINIVKFT